MRRQPTKASREKVLSFFRKLYLAIKPSRYDLSGRYFIYVLHHPYDSQLLLRGRQFVDQVALCRILASNLPAETRLLIKEHPIQPGMLSIGDIRRLASLYPNAKYLDYSVRFDDIVGNAAAVITINSTAGLEAMIHGVPVVVLGEGFYRGQPFVYDIGYLRELTNTLKEVLVHPRIPTEDEVVDLLARLIYETEPEPDVDGSDIETYITNGVKRRVRHVSGQHALT
jgi:hypothetical protein